MEKISKKEIRVVVADLIESSLAKVNISEPSDKTKKALVKLLKKFSTILHDEIKKLAKAEKKTLKAVNEAKLTKVKRKRKEM